MRSDMEEVFQGKVNKKAKNLEKIKAEVFLNLNCEILELQT